MLASLPAWRRSGVGPALRALPVRPSDCDDCIAEIRTAPGAEEAHRRNKRLPGRRTKSICRGRDCQARRELRESRARRPQVSQHVQRNGQRNCCGDNRTRPRTCQEIGQRHFQKQDQRNSDTAAQHFGIQNGQSPNFPQGGVMSADKRPKPGATASTCASGRAYCGWVQRSCFGSRRWRPSGGDGPAACGAGSVTGCAPGEFSRSAHGYPPLAQTSKYVRRSRQHDRVPHQKWGS